MTQNSNASVKSLVHGALEDVRELFREELALAKAEIRQESAKLRTAGAQLSAAAVTLGFAALFLLTAAALALSAALEWAIWTGFGTVGVLLAIGGGVLLWAARRSVRAVRPLPRTLDTLKENVR